MELACKCRTCKKAECEDGEVRCRPCHRRFQEWLHGGYEPAFNGVQAEAFVSPHFASEQGRNRSMLGRAAAHSGGIVPVDAYFKRRGEP